MVSEILKMPLASLLVVVYVVGWFWCMRFAKKELDYYYNNTDDG